MISPAKPKPHQRNYSQEIDSLKDRISKLVLENVSLRTELNKLYKRLDAMHDTVEYLRTRCYP